MKEQNNDSMMEFKQKHGQSILSFAKEYLEMDSSDDKIKDFITVVLPILEKALEHDPSEVTDFDNLEKLKEDFFEYFDYLDEEYFFQSEGNVMYYFNMWEEEVEEGIHDIRMYDLGKIESDEALFETVAKEKYGDMAKYIIYYKKHGELHPHIKAMINKYIVLEASKNIKNDLIKLANHFDRIGLIKEATYIDNLIKK